MKLLVNPSCMVQSGYAPPPLGLLYLAAMDNDTILFDAAIKGDPSNFIREHKPGLVGTSFYTPGRHESLRTLAVAKECGARTVAGGPHVAVMLDQLVENYDFIDHFVVGDGELAWRALCACEELPRVIKMPVRELDSLPIPKWDLIDLASYPARGHGIYRGVDLQKVPRVSVVLGRGCAGRCTFCSTWWVNGKYHSHGKNWMYDNLKVLWDKGARHLVFQDDCLTCDRQAALELCDILAEFQFAWFGTTRADMLDIELAARMKECGCYELSFGIESGSQEILRRMNKMLDLEKSIQARLICQKVGIKFTALIMTGFPFETLKNQQETQIFLTMLKPDEIGCIGHVMVLPGTSIYQACKEKGLIDDSFWLSPEPYYIYRGGLER